MKKLQFAAQTAVGFATKQGWFRRQSAVGSFLECRDA
jgi:hypothetical protein